MPILAGIARADRLSVLDDVRQGHDFGMARLLKGAGDVDLERAELAGERLQLRRVEPLRRKTQHAVFAECPQDFAEVARRERLCQIDALDRCAERLAGGCYFQHSTTSKISCHCERSEAIPLPHCAHPMGIASSLRSSQ